MLTGAILVGVIVQSDINRNYISTDFISVSLQTKVHTVFWIRFINLLQSALIFYNPVYYD
jgi:hypothetical protein